MSFPFVQSFVYSRKFDGLNSKALIISFGLFICPFLFSVKVQSQQIDPAYISISEGLASPNVQDLIQDSYGLIWIATTNGIQKYDGYTFTTFKNIPGKSTSLQNNNAFGLAEDADHNIWVATDLGASRYDRTKNIFINYDLSKSFSIGAGGGRIFNIVIDSENTIWAATQFLDLIFLDPSTDSWMFAEYNVPNKTTVHTGLMLGFTEDNQGGLWAGSGSYGLMHRPKGANAFTPVLLNTTGIVDFVLAENRITSLFSDTNNVIWITSRMGVYKYNPDTKGLTTIKEYNEGNIEILNHWNRIFPDPQGNIWISNNFRGILKFDGISDRFQEISVAGTTRALGRGWLLTLTDFMIDTSGIFWFSSVEKGLVKYDPVNKPFTEYVHHDSDPLSISNNGVFGIFASRVVPGRVYIGTRGSGLNVFDPVKKTFKKYTIRADKDMFGGSVRSIAEEEEDGSLWLGTWGGGLVKVDQDFKEVKRYEYNPLSSTSISNNQIRVIKKDDKGRIWVGTNNGLNIFNPSTGEFQRIASKFSRSYPKKLNELVMKLAESDQKIGIIKQVTDFQDLSQVVEIKEAGNYLVAYVGEGDVNGMADYGWIETVKKDTVWNAKNFDATFWAGGATKNRILIEQIKLNVGTYALRYFSDDSHSFDKWNEAAPDQTTLYGIVLIKPADENQVKSIEDLLTENKKELIISGPNITDIEVTEKYVWVSTNPDGLNRIDPTNNSVTYYIHDPKNDNSLSSNVIREVLEDKRGMIWTTTNAGINKFDPKTELFTRYTEEDGLPTNLTEAILEGDNGEIWISSQNGLSQMVTNEALGKITFINYNSTDGLGGDTFLGQAATRSPDGRFYFGGDHGLVTFSTITANSVPPALIISNFSISNKSVFEMGEDSPLSTSLFDLENIALSHYQNNLSFEFAALHYANPQKNQYAHMLKGYDEDWIYDNRNYASYTNLDPGRYEFKVRASNAYGIWNEDGKTISITIKAPWWRTWGAYGAYGFLFLSGVFGTDRFMRRRIKRRERERHREKERQHAKEIEKAYTNLKETQAQLIQSEKMASLGELTAGIAHEIQNPLNFVNNFSEVNKELLQEMKEEIDSGHYDEAKSIAKSIVENEEKILFHGKRADGIVKGMLQHSRSSDGVKEPTDINALADEYLRLAFHGLRAKDKSFNATMKTDFDQTIGKLNVIPQDMGRVILNLITNAFYAVSEKKQAHQNGYEPTVTISTKAVGDKLEISVSDNGDGIPQPIIDKIFQPFFTTKPSGKGTGLGLSMSYEIVTKLHGGELKVETKNGEGTTFKIVLKKEINN